MRRIMIVGSGGAGKSTFARELGSRLGISVYHLDALFWKPGWVMSSEEQELALLQDIAARDTWIIDGNYGGASLGLRLAAADTVVLLDLPRGLCLARVVRRWLRYRGRTRPDMGEDCPERLDRDFLQWIWTYPAVHRPRMLAHIRQQPHLTLVRLRSPREVQEFLERSSDAAPPQRAAGS